MIFLNSPIVRFTKAPKKREGLRPSVVVTGTVLSAVIAVLVVPAALLFATSKNITDCPLSPQSGRTIVNFPTEEKLLSNKGIATAEIGPIAVELPAGDYKVTLVAADGYKDRNKADQPRERYFVKLMKDNSEVSRTGKTSDLPDNEDYVRKSYVVNDKLTISKAVTAVVASHGDFPDKTSPNSIIPVCAAFDRIDVPQLTANCTVSKNTLAINEKATFTASAQGGTGSYTYAWSGSDNLSGSHKSVEKSFATSGDKTATVVITSGDKSISRTCSVHVEKPVTPALGASCNVSKDTLKTGETVNYAAYVWGGNGSYSYKWSGSESLSGTTKEISKSYTSTGEKIATVVVTSGGKSVTEQCTVKVTAEPTPVLNGSCFADPATAKTGDSITWRSTVSGGIGEKSYAWTGTDGLSGTSANVSKSYATEGTKSATLVITSGTQTITRTCTAEITKVEQPVALFAACGVAPLNPMVNQEVTWSASASGGNGGHTYAWTGTDELTGTGALIDKTYTATGTKTATVTVTAANGESVTKTCEVVVGSGVPLDDVPYTGFGDMLPIALFTTAVVAVSGSAGMMFIRRRRIDGESIWDDARMNL